MLEQLVVLDVIREPCSCGRAVSSHTRLQIEVAVSRRELLIFSPLSFRYSLRAYAEHFPLEFVEQFAVPPIVGISEIEVAPRGVPHPGVVDLEPPFPVRALEPARGLPYRLSRDVLLRHALCHFQRLEIRVCGVGARITVPLRRRPGAVAGSVVILSTADTSALLYRLARRVREPFRVRSKGVDARVSVRVNFLEYRGEVFVHERRVMLRAIRHVVYATQPLYVHLSHTPEFVLAVPLDDALLYIRVKPRSVRRQIVIYLMCGYLRRGIARIVRLHIDAPRRPNAAHSARLAHCAHLYVPGNEGYPLARPPVYVSRDRSQLIIIGRFRDHLKRARLCAVLKAEAGAAYSFEP